MRIEKTLNQPPAERITNLTRGRPLIIIIYYHLFISVWLYKNST